MVVFLRLGLTAAGAVGGMGYFFYHHLLPYFYTNPVWFPMGAISNFLAYLTTRSSEIPGFFFYTDTPNTTHSHCACSLEGNIGRAALSFHSGCDMRGLYDLNWIILCTLNTLQAGQIFPLSGALRAMGTTIILGSRASWCGQIHKDSYFPPPDSLAALLHSFNFYMCLVAVLLPVSREN